MTEIEKRQMALLFVTAMTLMSWVAAIKKLGYLIPGHAFMGIYHAALATPHSVILIAIPALTFILTIVLSVFAIRWTRSEFSGAQYSRHLRGSTIISPSALTAKTRRHRIEQITIADIPVPPDIETEHFLVGGATNVGKSVLIREMAYTATKRGDRLIVADPNGDIASKFWKPGDIILNPYDERSEGWSIFNEIRREYDFKRFSRSIVPLGQTHEAEEWADYGRLLLSETMRVLYKRGRRSMTEVFDYTNMKSADELGTLLKGTPAASLFVDNADKALGSARFVLSNKLPEHVKMKPGSFSIRRWLESDQPGNLYLTWREDMAVSLRPLISAWVDVICTSVLSMQEDPHRRLWLFLDELASLEKLASLQDALTKGRKHGLCVVAGLQSTAQLDDIYGEKQAQVLRACFKSIAALGCAKSDPATAENFSKALGEHEVERDQRGRTSNFRGSSSQSSTRHEKEPIVMPDQLKTLPPLQGFLSLSGAYPISKFRLTPIPFTQQIPAFVESVLSNDINRQTGEAT